MPIKRPFGGPVEQENLPPGQTVFGPVANIAAPTKAAGGHLQQQQVRSAPLNEIQVHEGQNARIDLRITGQLLSPIEWYKDGNLLQQSNKFKILSSQDGSQAFEISKVTQADSGIYTVVAKTPQGILESSTRLVVKSLTYVPGQVQAAGPRPSVVEKFPPVTVREGEIITLKCKTVGHQNPNIVWTKDNVQIQSGQGRFKIDHKSEESTLTIDRAKIEDSGWYQCIVTSPIGTNSIQGKVTVQPSLAPQLKTAGGAPKWRQEGGLSGPNVEISKLKQVERQQAATAGAPIPASTQAPSFSKPIHDLGAITEGGNAHFECSFAPANDPGLKIVWLFKGKALQESPRLVTAYQNGVATLDIYRVTPQDAGTYTVLAVNSLGQVQHSANLQVTASSFAPQPAAAYGGPPQGQMGSAFEQKRRKIDEGPRQEVPNFVSEIRNIETIENRPVRLEAKLTPANDPTLKVEWFHNGKPMLASNRYKPTHNFGYAILDISGAKPEDSGTYTCRAINSMGTVETNGVLFVQPEAAARAATQWADQNEWESDEVLVHQPPKFVTKLQNKDVQEGGRAYFEARVTPQNDPHLKVEWYKDGFPLQMANRIQVLHNFGHVSLNINPAYPEDNGTYTCVAINRTGQDQTQAQLVCHGKESLLLQPQHATSLAQTQQIDSQKVHIGPVLPERPEEHQSMKAPKFTKPLVPHQKANQEDRVHLVARVTPSNDPRMKVEWYKDGYPLGAAHRFKPAYDFGHVTLDILYAIPEDSGTYTAVATNDIGQDTTQMQLEVSSKKALYLDPQHPEGLDKIQQLEAARPEKPEEVPILCEGAPKIIGKLNDQTLKEGENLFLPLQVTPANDPTMHVDWYLNGKQIITGNRIHATNEFGHINLNVKHLIGEDSGEYIVHIYNDKGETHTSCNVTVTPDKVVKTDTQHQQSLQKIQDLESLEKFAKTEVVDREATGPPRFVVPLPQGLPVIEEGQPLHLEAKVEPVYDNSMIVEWFHNDKPITTGHRFKPFRDFGFVSLDIVNLYPEDSGTYTCYAKNAHGEAYTQCPVQCSAKKSIILDTDRPSSVKKITELEAPKPAPAEVAPGPKPKPAIIVPLANGDVQEGESIQLKCQYTPKDDNKLKVYWFFNNQPVAHGHRFQLSNDFGHAALNILYAYPEDSGVYKCVVKNESGEAATECTLKCAGKTNMILDTSHPDSWQKIQVLEAPKEAAPEAPEGPKQPPAFVKQLQNLDGLVEGQTCHLDCQVTPVDDPNLRIEWFRDGRPLPASSRFKHLNEFGYVSLDILHTFPEDTGVFTCRATNESGKAETKCTIKCQPKHNIILDPNNPQSWLKIKQMEEAKPAEPSEAEAQIVKPHFIQELTGPTEVLKEGQTVNLKCQALPNNDPKLQVQWLFNGKPLDHASRFRPRNEFGFISLDILHMYPEDSGTYTVRVWNDAGEATTSFKIDCKPLRSLYLETQHDQSWQRIQELENKEVVRPPSPEMRFPKPNFTQALQNMDNIPEAEPVRLECHLQPVGDPTMRIQWLHNGQPIPQGSRFRPTYDFDTASLDILTLYPEDSGVYSCRAVSEFGEAVTSCTVKCLPKESLLLDTQHEQSWQQIQEIENRKPPEPVVEKLVICPPRFVIPLQDYPTAPEGHPIHLEAQLEPTNDPNMKIQWYHDGQPLVSGHRFRTTHDFSYVALDILYAFPEDGGTWTCQAVNALGQAESSAKCQIQPRHTIVADVQHPKSWQKIQEIEAPKAAPAPAPERGHEIPKIVQQIQNAERLEGQPAHFECRLTPITDPNLKVEWYKNGRPLAMSNRMKPTVDFGFVSLDIAHTVPEDAGQYTIRAVNDAGEATSTAVLKVTPRDSIISSTQHPSSWQKIQVLEAPQAPTAPRLEPAKVKPKFITPLNSCLDLIEGQPAHFEATLEPVDDNTLRVEWYKDGQLVQPASRNSMYHEFGLVALDLHYVFPEDNGTYTCKAINAAGEATTSGPLQCKARSSIYLDTLHKDSLDKIRIIEAPKVQPELLEPTTFQKPVFTEPLKNVDNVPEGEPIRLECRIIPVNDPKLKIEWYHNNRPLPLSNRIMMHRDFGQVILDFKSTFAHDSGVYMCRAVNELGEAVSTASVTIAPKASLYLDSQHPETHRQTQILEGLDKFPKYEIPDKVFDKPVIRQPLQNVDNLKEGDSIVLECHVEPVNDPKLTVEWFHNDKPVHHANRFQLKKDFGVHTLAINHVIPEDSGVYTCRVKNDHGSANTSASVKIEGYEAIQRDTKHPVSWQRIIELETPVIHEVPEPVIQIVKPHFVKPLENLDNIPEGQAVQLIAHYEPAKDNTLQAEWSHNGQVIPASQLVKSKCELGQATLDIWSTHPDHSGVYTLKLKNPAGEAVTSATLKVLGIHPVRGDVQHETSWQRIQELEAPKPQPPPLPDKQFAPPSFLKHIDNVEVAEGEPSKFQCQFEPTGDNTLEVEWYRNGNLLSTGSKYVTNVDFGCATLDILYTYPEDSGVYVCKLKNKSGEAQSSATLKCSPKEAIIRETQNPASAAAVALLEAPKGVAPELPEKAKTPPVFLSQLPNLGDLYEGQAAHFETFYEPVDDNTLKIKWYHNGQPVEASSRLKMVNDFGWVILDISSTDGRDTGEWTCVAENVAGKAQTMGKMNIIPRETIIFEPQQPQSLSKIYALERPKEAPEEFVPGKAPAPKFVTKLPGFPPFSEGDSAHLEAKLTPVTDPKMKVHWYKDGKPLQYGHRFKPIQDFGFCILDILYITPEDSGEYECRAENESGKDATKTVIKCAPQEGLILEPQVPGKKVQAIQTLEENLRRVPVKEEIQLKQRAPVFVVPLQNPPPMKEGEHAYFSAKVEPADDNQLKIQWYQNGQPLTTGSRVKTINDFGYTILEINPVYPEDSGEYVCKATNNVGEAVTKASLVCEGKKRIIQETQLPNKMSGAHQKIKILDAPKPQPAPLPDKVYGPPKFRTQLQDIPELVDGQLAHFECQLDPVADPNLKIEWFHNGEPVFHTSRMKMIHEFGFVILEISPAEPQDTGEYICRATNLYGTDQTKANIKVKGLSGVSYDWQQPDKKERITELEDYLHRVIEPPVIPDKDFDAPNFVEPLTDMGELMEADAVHFQAKLDPVGDPSMRVQWFHNGQPIPYSSRIMPSHEFGYVNLDIKHLIPEDSGEYTCVAKNKKGQSQTVGKIVCRSKVDVDSPKFIVPLNQEMPGVIEGDDVHLECRVTPLTDPKLQILWYFNDKPLLNGSRFKMVHDFGFVSLDIKSVIAEDTGKYTCRAVNDKGEAFTACEFRVAPKPTILFQRQAPKQTMADLERHIRQYTDMPIALKPDDFYQDGLMQPPKFLVPIKNAAVNEGEFVKFETQLSPINDPNLKVEWYRNGQPVSIGHRFLTIHDFGYVALVLLYALPEDIGEYQAKAKSLVGQDQTNKASLVCAPKKGVITESQLPPGMSIAAISKLEDQLYWKQQAEPEARPKMKMPPVFTIPLRRVQVYENEPARFECAVTGSPKPKVTWYINGRQAVDGSRYKLSYDGMYYLLIPHVRAQDAGEIQCVAHSPEGVAQTATTLDVYMTDDFRSHKLRSAYQISPEELAVREEQWKLEMLGSLGQAFQKAPRADLSKLMRVELEKGPPESLETQELVGKFTKKRAGEDKFYDQIFSAEHQRPAIPPVNLQPVQLKPAEIIKRDLPKEEMAKVDLRTAPRTERTGTIPAEQPWAKTITKKPLSTQDEEKKYKMKPAIPKEVEIPAKSQVSLKIAKPKPATEQEPFAHVQIAQRADKVQFPKQKPEVPKEVNIPAADQVSLKTAFKPREVIVETPKIEVGPLKPAPVVQKVEERKEVSFPKNPAPIQKSAKQAPAFGQKLAPVKAELGRAVRFYCDFSGDQPIQVTWTKDGQPVVASFEYQIKTTPTNTSLEIGKAKAEHAGSYTVRIENVAGRADSTANLLVGEKTDTATVPVFAQTLSEMKVNQGHGARFDIKISGKPSSVLWFKDGKQIIPDERRKVLIDKDTYSLFFVEALPQDSGVYECIARNSKGEGRCKGSLQVALSKPVGGFGPPKGGQIVQQFQQIPGQMQTKVEQMKPVAPKPKPGKPPAGEAPNVTKPLQAQIIKLGQKVTLFAEFTGTPTPTAAWFLNDKPVQKTSDINMTISGNVASLVIARAAAAHCGKFTCRLSNPSGTAETSAVLKEGPAAPQRR